MKYNMNRRYPKTTTSSILSHLYMCVQITLIAYARSYVNAINIFFLVCFQFPTLSLLCLQSAFFSFPSQPPLPPRFQGDRHLLYSTPFAPLTLFSNIFSLSLSFLRTFTFNCSVIYELTPQHYTRFVSMRLKYVDDSQFITLLQQNDLKTNMLQVSKATKTPLHSINVVIVLFSA